MSNLFDLLEKDYPDPPKVEADPKPELPVPSEAASPELTVLWKGVPKDARNWIRRSLDTFISDLEGSAKDIRRKVGEIPPLDPKMDEKTRNFFMEAREGPLGFAEKNERRATAWRSVRAFVSEMDGKIGVILTDQVELATIYKLEP